MPNSKPCLKRRPRSDSTRESDSTHGETPKLTLRDAVDKHVSELAYFLYTHNFSEADGPTRKKMEKAMKVITAELAERRTGDGGEWERFIREALEGKSVS